MKSYFILMNGEPKGPYPLQMILEMGLPDETLLRESTMSSWIVWKEIREELLTGYKVGKASVYAGFGWRILALSFDMIILYNIIVLLCTNLGNYSALIPIVFICIVYSLCFECSPLQGTPGKIILGIKVVDCHMQRLKFGQALGRDIAKLLSVIIIGIGWLMIVFTRQKQSLHDKVASTYVVHREISEKKRMKKITLGMTVLLVVSSVLYIMLGVVFPGKIYFKTEQHLSYGGISFTYPAPWKFDYQENVIEKTCMIERIIEKEEDNLILFLIFNYVLDDPDQGLKVCYDAFLRKFEGMEGEPIRDGRYNIYKTRVLPFRYGEFYGSLSVFNVAKRAVCVLKVEEAGKTEPGFKIIEYSFKIKT